MRDDYGPPRLDGRNLVELGYRIVHGDKTLRLPDGKEVDFWEPVKIGCRVYQPLDLVRWIEESQDPQEAIEWVKNYKPAGKRKKRSGKRTVDDRLGLIGREFVTPPKRG